MTDLSAGWRTSILQHFTPASAAAGRLTVVSDPDGLLTEPTIGERLVGRGFELLTIGDPVAFRFVYESEFRARWDRGEATHLVVIVRGDGNAKRVPWDLLEEAADGGRVLSFSLKDVFPTLAPTVVAALPTESFERLWEATSRATRLNLGEDATADFVLQHVFDASPDKLQTPADLLQLLLRHHYKSQVLPDAIEARLVETLKQTPTWRAWPLDRIVGKRDVFLSFVAERWPHFLRAHGCEAADGRPPSVPQIAGPIELPFDHDDVRVYMVNYFVDGLLKPTFEVRPGPVEKWFAVGIAESLAASPVRRFEVLSGELGSSIPDPTSATHTHWLDFSLRWGTWTRLRWSTRNVRDAASEADAAALAQRTQSAFSTWLVRKFGSLSTLPYLPMPVLGHHVPHFMAHQLNSAANKRIALLVIDGLAVDQWRIVRDALPDFAIDEHAMFSWIPTLTQIGRQAIFSGRIPSEFSGSIDTTLREAAHWSKFWTDAGLRPQAIAHVPPQGDNEPFEDYSTRVLNAATPSAVRVLGAVVTLVDQSLHGVVRGTPALHAAVSEWAESGELARLLRELHDRNYEVYLTADHGNVSGRGCGKPNVGETAEQRGERVIIFRNGLLRDQASATLPNALRWPQIGLPADYFALMAPHGACFVGAGKETVSHGGIALEEVIVPFIRITPR